MIQNLACIQTGQPNLSVISRHSRLKSHPATFEIASLTPDSLVGYLDFAFGEEHSGKDSSWDGQTGCWLKNPQTLRNGMRVTALYLDERQTRG